MVVMVVFVLVFFRLFVVMTIVIAIIEIVAILMLDAAISVYRPAGLYQAAETKGQ